MPSGGQASVASYLAYLLEVNQSMNLTAVRNLDDAYERHVGDSLALLPVLDEAFASQQLREGQPLSLMDVGSGCGVPGIILAAARPDWQVLACDRRIQLLPPSPGCPRLGAPRR
jgi:16S rRNA (guanine527-N7)-methyltransferase